MKDVVLLGGERFFTKMLGPIPTRMRLVASVVLHVWKLIVSADLGVRLATSIRLGANSIGYRTSHLE